MTNVLSNYLIEERTLALIPGYSINYHSIVLTISGEIYVKQTPMEIIEASCKKEFTSYTGSRKIVTELTDFTHKVPIPFHVVNGAFIFPTHSPLHHDCFWIFSHRIKKIEKVEKNTDEIRTEESIIHFVNGEKLKVPVSKYSIDNQVSRATICKNILDAKNDIMVLNYNKSSV